MEQYNLHWISVIYLYKYSHESQVEYQLTTGDMTLCGLNIRESQYRRLSRLGTFSTYSFCSGHIFLAFNRYSIRLGILLPSYLTVIFRVMGWSAFNLTSPFLIKTWFFSSNRTDIKFWKFRKNRSINWKYFTNKNRTY